MRRNLKRLPVIGRYFFVILELNDIGEDIHVKDAVLQWNLDLALNSFIEDSNISPG